MIYYFFYKMALFLRSINPESNRYKYPHETALFILLFMLTMNIFTLMLFLNYKSIFDNVIIDMVIILALFIIFSHIFISNKKLDVFIERFESKKRNDFCKILSNLLNAAYIILSFYLFKIVK